MLELEIILDFTCCLCRNPLGVTLKCAGIGLNSGGMASVKIPCPSCGDINQIFFTPEDGALHDVRPVRQSRLIAEPSYN
jgi:phage FluMu protein Com